MTYLLSNYKDTLHHLHALIIKFIVTTTQFNRQLHFQRLNIDYIKGYNALLLQPDLNKI